MNKLEVLKKKQEGIPFGKKVSDIIKENYSDILNKDLELEYVEAMIKEVVHKPETTLLIIDDYGDIVNYAESNLRIAIQSEHENASTLNDNNIEGIEVILSDHRYSRHRWSTNEAKLRDLYILSDAQAYANFIIQERNDALEEVIKDQKDSINRQEKMQNRLIELGLNFLSEDSHDLINQIEKIETIRGEKLTKANANELIKAFGNI